jgi:hypothetical protein
MRKHVWSMGGAIMARRAQCCTSCSATSRRRCWACGSWGWCSPVLWLVELVVSGFALLRPSTRQRSGAGAPSCDRARAARAVRERAAAEITWRCRPRRSAAELLAAELAPLAAGDQLVDRRWRVGPRDGERALQGTRFRYRFDDDVSHAGGLVSCWSRPSCAASVGTDDGIRSPRRDPRDDVRSPRTGTPPRRLGKQSGRRRRRSTSPVASPKRSRPSARLARCPLPHRLSAVRVRGDHVAGAPSSSSAQARRRRRPRSTGEAAASQVAFAVVFVVCGP